jgi:hypothetical protein
MNTGTCRSCKASILWVVMQSGRAMPLDAEPSASGTIVVDGEHARVAKPDPADPQPRYTSHFATCPGAGQHRRPR